MTDHPLDQHILELLEKNGEMRSRDIYATKPKVSKNTIRSRMAKLTDRGIIERVQNGLYKKSVSADIQTQFTEARKKFSSDARAAEANKVTIDNLMNTYDQVLIMFQNWVLENIAQADTINFEKQLLFIENFKWLTMIGDRLMKRWKLEHVGYDTNTRQAQEDAKAKTVEKEKAALKDAPVEETVRVLGSFNLKTKELIDNFPTLESLEEENTEEIKV